MRSSLQRIRPRRSYRTRRQTGNGIGVIRCRRFQVCTRKFAIITLSHPVNHGWVGLQAHTNA
ncbi:Uncharacterised protein [Shigella sonnei]|nr:Uncharacterised protein [Shigella sonnei]